MVSLRLPYVVVVAAAGANAVPALSARPKLTPTEMQENEETLAAIDARHSAGVLICDAGRRSGCCGDGVCDDAASETILTCVADCPGVTTDATCNEEPHSDRQ